MTSNRTRLSGRKMLKALALGVVAIAGLCLLLAKVDAASLYPWAKSFHVIAVISWMAGLLYLPRLFAYHCAADMDSNQSATFKIMERRLYRAIILPAMVATWFFGIYLAWTGFRFEGGWLHAKIFCVLVLSGFTAYLGTAARRFEGDRNERSQRHWRLMNEVPTLLMIIIVILVIVKPF